MAVNNDGWVDWAQQMPGPDWKQYREHNLLQGIAWHSAEGYMAGLIAELNRATRHASWTFVIRLDGTLVQHYPIWASTWTSGNKVANTRLMSVELEGVAGQPLTSAQIVTCKKLVIEWENFTGRRAVRIGSGKNMWEHREVWDWGFPNAGSTACPSSRANPVFNWLNSRTVAIPVKEKDDMNTDEIVTRLDELEDKIDRVSMRGQRLNDVLVNNRFKLIALAMNPDALEVEKAVDILTRDGFLD